MTWKVCALIQEMQTQKYAAVTNHDNGDTSEREYIWTHNIVRGFHIWQFKTAFVLSYIWNLDILIS